MEYLLFQLDLRCHAREWRKGRLFNGKGGKPRQGRLFHSMEVEKINDMKE